MKPLFLGTLVSGALFGCSDLAEVAPGTCGNLVVEAAEQCDGEANCGTSGPAACRFTCEQGVSDCPGDLACGTTGLCSAPANAFPPFSAAARYEFPVDDLAVGDLDGDHRDDLIGVGRSLRIRFGAGAQPLLESYEKAIRPPTGAATFGQLDDGGGLDVVVPTADGVFTFLSRGRTLEAVPYASAQTPGDDSARRCPRPAGWATCMRGDFDRDGALDRAGFELDRDNVLVELSRGAGTVSTTIDTEDIVTDLTTGDLDGDGYDDIAFSGRSSNGVTDGTVAVVYGAPQLQTQKPVTVLRARDVTGIAAQDRDIPADGIADLTVARTVGGSSGISIYLGSSARDLSAPFRLSRGAGALDRPYAVVAGEFVGGPGSGVDVMAYARDPADPDSSYFWWLRGLGNAQLEVGATDRVDATKLDFLAGDWKVADLLDDPSRANGPDEVIGLSPRAPACAGPALTAAVPSARFTATELLQSACLGVPGTNWSARQVSIVGRGATARSSVLAQRGEAWWLGETARLESALLTQTLAGALVALPDHCRDPQVWPQTPSAGTFVSWVCERDDDSTIVGLRQSLEGDTRIDVLATVPRDATHLVGDFTGDGLTDLVVRSAESIAVLPQCAVDDPSPGC